MNLSRTNMMLIRAALIQLLNALDDALGLPRTAQSRQERRSTVADS